MSDMGDIKFTTAGDMMTIDYDKLVEKYDYDTKLDITAWVISKLDDHGTSPGSFRHLIYNLLGFGIDAYSPLYEAGGMNITNELDYKRPSILLELIKKQAIENIELKRFANVCDEPGCFEHANCGWPSDTGYRRTCYEHSNFEKNR